MSDHPCADGHTWTSYYDVTPDHGTPCDCGLKKWGMPLIVKREHEWEFYANGSFCRRCGAAIGSGTACK